MPVYKLEAVVLRTREYGETDRLVTLLDREGVRRTALAKGARRPRSSLAAGVQPYTYSRFLLWRGRSLDGISQVEVIDSLAGLRGDLAALAAAACVAELAEAFTQEGAPSPGVFPVVLGVLRALAAAPGDVVRHQLLLRHAEMRLLDLAGLGIQLERCQDCGRVLGPSAGRVPPAGYSAELGGALCAGCRPARPAALPLDPATWQVLRRARQPALAAVARLRPDRGVLARAAEITATHLGYHLGRTFRSPAFLAILDEASLSGGILAGPPGGGDGSRPGRTGPAPGMAASRAPASPGRGGAGTPPAGGEIVQQGGWGA